MTGRAMPRWRWWRRRLEIHRLHMDNARLLGAAWGRGHDVVIVRRGDRHRHVLLSESDAVLRAGSVVPLVLGVPDRIRLDGQRGVGERRHRDVLRLFGDDRDDT